MLEQLFYSEPSFSFHSVGLILTLVSLEAVLSADNAVALAALVQDIKDTKKQRQALNLGLVGAFGLRVLLLLTASWIIQFWQFQLAGAFYLLWLASRYFWERFVENESIELHEGRSQQQGSFWRVVTLIGITDLAFSIDSVTTAVALSNQLWLVLFGGMLGVITLRFLTSLFVKWLTEFSYLQDAAYLTILVVGLKLFFQTIIPTYILPEWMMVSIVAVLFTWGFSKKLVIEVD